MNYDLNTIDSKVVELLLIGCDNPTIARELGMKQRTLKARFARMFQRFGIQGRFSSKRVVLAMHFCERRTSIPENVALTDRERTIAELIRDGFSNRQIAERIGSTENMVKNSLRQIFDRTGMGSRLELALWMSK